MQNIYETKNLVSENSISYPDINILKSKINFISGKSGVGKSMLLKLFNRTLNFYSGEIFYEGKNINSYDTIILRREVLLSSQNVFLFDKTIHENFGEFYNYLEKEKLDEENIKAILKICCCNFSLDKRCVQLSGGERLRVYIAICLSLNPKVLMLDEPTSALDEDNAIKLIGNVAKYCKEKNITLIIVSHDKNLIKLYSENTIVIGEN